MPRQRPHPSPSLTFREIAWLAGLAFAGTWWVVPHVEALMMSSQERIAIETSVTYSGCNEVRALGLDPLYAGEPG